MNTRAAQWWVWRITSPASTSKDSRMTESNAVDTVCPCSGGYGPWYTVGSADAM